MRSVVVGMMGVIIFCIWSGGFYFITNKNETKTRQTASSEISVDFETPSIEKLFNVPSINDFGFDFNTPIETMSAEQEEEDLPEKIVYLTFDDGPSALTQMVLTILEREGIKATFFVLGENVERYPNLASQIVNQGHSIGNHSYNHVYKEIYSSFSTYSEQLIQTGKIIYDTTGKYTPLVRAPGGTFTNFDDGYFDALHEAGFIVHDWNVDSGDSKSRSVTSDEIVEVIKQSVLKDTMNVLLHDSVGHEASINALPRIISYYKELGYIFLPLTEQVEPIVFRTSKNMKWERKEVTATEKAAFIEQVQDLQKLSKASYDAAH